METNREGFGQMLLLMGDSGAGKVLVRVGRTSEIIPKDFVSSSLGSRFQHGIVELPARAGIRFERFAKLPEKVFDREITQKVRRIDGGIHAGEYVGKPRRIVRPIFAAGDGFPTDSRNEPVFQFFVIRRDRCGIRIDIRFDDRDVHQEASGGMESFFQLEECHEPLTVYGISRIVHEVLRQHVRRRQPLFEKLRRDFDEIRLRIETGIFGKLGLFCEKMDDVAEFVEYGRSGFDGKMFAFGILGKEIATDGANGQYGFLFS